MHTLRIMTLTTFVLVTSAIAFAEDAAELGLRYAQVQQAGLELIKEYAWQTSTKVTKAGELKAEVSMDNRLNEKGEIVQTVESAEVNAKRKRGLRGRAQQEGLAEAEAFLDKVAAATGAYVFMSKGQEVDFFDKATITDGTGDDAGRLVVTAKGVLADGDTVTKTIDPKTMFPAKIIFETTVDGTAIKGEVLLRAIEGGPNVPRMATVTVPATTQVIETEFLNYKKQL